MQSSSAIAPSQTEAMTSKGQLVWLAGGLFCISILLGNPNYQWSEYRSSPFAADFVQEWVGGDMLFSGAAGHIYDRAAFQAWQHDADRLGFTWPADQYYPAVYPPPYYCLIAPLALLPYRVAAIVWLSMLVGAYCLAARLAIQCWSDRVSWRAQGFWCIGLLLPAMFFGCVLGQKGSVWLLIVAASVWLLKRDRPWPAGCVAALLTLKPTLCVLLPLAMLFSGQWRFCLGFLSTSIAIYGGSALILPYAIWSDYLQVVLGASEYQTHAGYRSGWSTSLLSLLSAIAVPKLLSAVALVLALVGLVVACVRRSRAIRAVPMTDPVCLWQLLAGTALLSPHAYFDDLAWLLLPLSGLLDTQPRQAMRKLAIVWIGMVIGQAFEYGPAVPAIALLLALL